ncbi:hypothetical protein [Streptomyces sp. SPB074]|uniref:hypothetical protein n=1 Tax=Streptomyces sp. (strain SPB074) TaxID=465543 RepID=UPI00017FEA14|nr:hypothetical protein [Streptomyces sp. SPB074]
MDAATWVAAGAGLTGTVLGGAISTWSALVTQKRTAASLQDEKKRDRARSAAEEILEQTALFTFAGGEDRTPTRQALSRVHRLVQHISQTEVRIRIEEDAFLLAGRPSDDPRSTAQRLADYAIVNRDIHVVLGAYLRDEPWPPQAERIGQIRRLYTNIGWRSDR